MYLASLLVVFNFFKRQRKSKRRENESELMHFPYYGIMDLINNMHDENGFLLASERMHIKWSLFLTA